MRQCVCRLDDHGAVRFLLATLPAGRAGLIASPEPGERLRCEDRSVAAVACSLLFARLRRPCLAGEPTSLRSVRLSPRPPFTTVQFDWCGTGRARCRVKNLEMSNTFVEGYALQAERVEELDWLPEN